MILPLAAFFATLLVCFVLALLFVRGGKNRDEILTKDGPRALIFGNLTRALAGTLPTSEANRERLTGFLRSAGHYHRPALTEYLALRNILVVGWLLLIIAVMVVATEPGDSWMLPLVAVAGIGAVILFSIPRLVLETAAKGRLHRIEEGLPDALDMITMCMAGGMPLQMALGRVSGELKATHPDLAFEMKVVGRQTEAGSLAKALRQFANRIDTPQVQSLAAIIGQTDMQGASVAGAFEDFADDVREARRQRADEQGNKTALKMLFPLVFCLAPPVYMLLLAPAVIEMKEFISRESAPGGALTAPQNMSAVLDENDVPELGLGDSAGIRQLHETDEAR